MRCKGLFDSNKVVFIPVTNESVGDMMRDVKSYACHHGVTIKTECGIFVKQDTMEVEKVIRCEVIGEIKPHKVVAIKKENVISEEKLRKMKEIQEMWEAKRERNKQIIEDCKNGVSVADISKKYNLSRQGVYNVLAKGTIDEM
jgi:hypothetical protein